MPGLEFHTLSVIDQDGLVRVHIESDSAWMVYDTSMGGDNQAGHIVAHLRCTARGVTPNVLRDICRALAYTAERLAAAQHPALDAPQPGD